MSKVTKQDEAPTFQEYAWTAEQDSGNGEYSSGPTGFYINKSTGERINQAQFDAGKAENHRINMLKQGLNPDGTPIAPEFKSLIDPDTGKLKDIYQLKLDELDAGKLEGYNMLKELATQKGPSKYAQAANQQAEFSRQNLIDQGVAQQAGAMSQMGNRLAMRGGSNAGMSERMAMSGARDLLGAKQGAYRQEAGNLLEIMKQDEAMKRQALSQFGEAEGRIAMNNLDTRNRANQYNISELLRQEDRAANWQMDQYKEKMDKWAAERQADATAKSGGGGGGK